MTNQASLTRTDSHTHGFWCRNHAGQEFTFEEYLDFIKSFHGYAAPGLIIGGKMVDTALNHIPQGILFDAICETTNCLPDAIQLLTPCTAGNNWMKLIHLGRFALSLYDKYKGSGVRVFVDTEKLKKYKEISNWFFKLLPKPEQDTAALVQEIREAGDSILSVWKIQVRPQFMEKHGLGEIAVCPLCHEAYPAKHGALCRGCQGDAPYFSSEDTQTAEILPFLRSIPLEQAKGEKILHDMTQIIPGKSKGPAFRKGQIIGDMDLCRLQQMGRAHIYADDKILSDPEWVHEDEAAFAFAKAMAGEGVTYEENAHEGKVNLLAARDGMLLFDEQQLERFNLVPDVMCASRKNHSLIRRDHHIAGTRAIPLFLSKSGFHKAMRVLEQKSLFRIQPLRKANAGILVTGTEVFRGLIQDRFVPIIQSKLEALGSCMQKTVIVPDEREAISSGVASLLESGADLIVTTAGLSVDPDDLTRKGLADAGVTDMIYGAPILPGAMTLLTRIGKIPVIGVPACALYFKTTAFDLLLPRLLAGLTVTRADLAKMGNGAFCLGCKTCTFPRCPFGK
ncbi:MAG: FmdE family protein [Desulfococcaceae bacterium]